MKYSFLANVIFLLVLSISVYAQENLEITNLSLTENTFEMLELSQLESQDVLNFTITKQVGNHNEIELISTHQGGINRNIVAVAQFGNNNTGIINQDGNKQGIGIYQDGNQNLANLYIKGNNVYSVVTQVGNHNYVKQDIENDNTDISPLKSVLTEQYGNHNSINLETGIYDYAVIEIKQHGNNNNAELDLTGASFQTEPYQIDQTGNNAEVIITKSDFYMPMKSNLE